MSSCDNPNYELAVTDGSRRRELSLFEEEDFCPESYVLSRLRTVEEEEETPWKSAVYRNFCACVRRRHVYHCATNTKNELRVLIAELKGLQRISAKEMIKSMISHYSLFIQTSQEVTELEQAILKLRTLLRSRAAVVRNLAAIEWTVPAADPKQSKIVAGCYTGNDLVVSELEEDAKSLPDVFDVLFAERKVDLALSLLEQGEDMVDKGYACTDLESGLSPVTPIIAAFLQIELLERRARIVNYLSDICQQPSVRGVELRSAIAALNRLGEGARAHTLLLLAHHGRLKHNVHGLRPSGTSYGGAFTAALSQMTFSAIAQAERDSLTVFGANPAFTSELVVWARHVTEQYAGQIKQHVLSSAAAAGGLQAAAECVQIAFGHCSLLEAQGLILCPSLVKVFRSSVEQAVEANLKRIEESVTALASADDWTLVLNPQTPLFNSRRSPSRTNVKLSFSAHRFNAMAQDFMAGVSPLVSMQLAGVALEGLALRFNNYVDMLIKAVPDTSKVQKSLFFRLSSISKAGKEIASSGEGVFTPFFARLLEVFVSSMDEDNFWSIIEDGPIRIGSIGLKQFVLDMQFVIEMALSRGCGSRLLHSLVPDLTSRAVHAFAATGADPESALPSDEWFLEAARVAVDKLSEEWNQPKTQLLQ